MKETGSDNLFDLPPASMRDLFERGTGPFAGMQFGSTQTGVDVREFESQTENPERRAAVMQCPDDLVRGGGASLTLD